MKRIQFKKNTASKEKIIEYLFANDNGFFLPLSSRVNIVEYAKKIVDKAVRFEAWMAGELVGLLAVYCNNMETKIAYITSINVSKSYTSIGIASHLMRMFIDYAKTLDINQTRLEVSMENIPAIKLYQKYGFIIDGEGPVSATMSLNMKNREKDDITKKL